MAVEEDRVYNVNLTREDHMVVRTAQYNGKIGKCHSQGDIRFRHALMTVGFGVKNLFRKGNMSWVSKRTDLTETSPKSAIIMIRVP